MSLINTLSPAQRTRVLPSKMKIDDIFRVISEQKALSHHVLAVQNPKFQQWFSGSKVVDTNGNPLVVYKSMFPYDWTKETDKEDGPEITSIDRKSPFPAFDPEDEEGIKIAGFFGSLDVANRFSKTLGTRQATYPVYLKLTNPWIFDANGEKAGNIQFGKSGRPFREAMRSGKYDGAIIKNTNDEETIFVAMYPNQIKSVFAKEFNPSSDNISE